MADLKESFELSDGTGWATYGTTWSFQTWTTTSAYVISDVALYGYKYGSCGNVTVSIREVDGVTGKPKGADKCSVTVAEGVISDFPTRAWYTFTFVSSYALDDATQYAIVIRATGGNAANYYAPFGYGSSGYADGGSGTGNGTAWSVVNTTNDIDFRIYGIDSPAKPTSPAPGHEETGVEFPTTPLSYIASDDPPADTYDIYFRIQGGVYTKIVETQDITSWRMPYVILNIKDYNPALATGYRSPVAGDVLTHGDDSYTISYVTVGDLINVQYQAKLYALRTAGPGNKSPGDILTNEVAPDVENPQAVRVTLNDQWHFHGVVEEIFLPPGTTFEWRVDATNEVGTTEGNTWEFTTQAFRFVKTSYVLIVGGSGMGPYDYPPGEEGTDWNWTGENNMMAVRRLVAAANNKIWVEDI